MLPRMFDVFRICRAARTVSGIGRNSRRLEPSKLTKFANAVYFLLPNLIMYIYRRVLLSITEVIDNFTISMSFVVAAICFAMAFLSQYISLWFILLPAVLYTNIYRIFGKDDVIRRDRFSHHLLSFVLTLVISVVGSILVMPILSLVHIISQSPPGVKPTAQLRDWNYESVTPTGEPSLVLSFAGNVTLSTSWREVQHRISTQRIWFCIEKVSLSGEYENRRRIVRGISILNFPTLSLDADNITFPIYASIRLTGQQSSICVAAKERKMIDVDITCSLHSLTLIYDWFPGHWLYSSTSTYQVCCSEKQYCDD